MKPSLSPTWTRTLCAVLGLTLLAGCTTTLVHYPNHAYEYRYRIFESQEKLPSLIKEPLSGSLTLQKFMSPQALNVSMDLMAQEGFQLYTIRQIPGTSEYTFTFRRPIPEGFRPTRAPMEFTGVYQAQPPADPAMYYAFQPRFKGYTIFVFTPGSLDPKRMNADWDDKHGELRVQVGAVENTFKMSADGLVIGHVQDELVDARLKRNIIYLRRLQSGD